MKNWKYIASASIFVAMTAAKLIVPGAHAAMSAYASEFIDRNDDYTQAAAMIKDRVYPKDGERVYPKPTENPADLASGRTLPSEPFEIPSYDELRNAILPEQPHAEEKKELPVAVTTFLASQAEFSDEPLPENVSYDYEEIPFEYSVPVSGYTSSGFGFRVHPILDALRFHYGTDFAANSGDNVTAFASGTVEFAGTSDSYGNYIIIDHGEGWKSLYAHCSVLYVSSGDEVEEGELIALVGATGLTTGPHLHFELTKDGVYYNPEYYACEEA